MSRLARVVVPGFPHHVTQRGNRCADVFEDDEDRRTYLRFLRQYAQRRGLAVWAYCLMTNHVHLVVVPEKEDSLAKGLRDAHTVYALRFNTRTGMSGHLWQGRFYSCVLDETHLWAAVRYVERNPVRAGMTDRAENYEWSSAPAHCGLRTDPLLSNEFPAKGVIDDWASWLRNVEDEEAVARVRRQTQTGRPCGTSVFLTRLESLLNRTLTPGKRGRKRKPASDTEKVKKR